MDAFLSDAARILHTARAACQVCSQPQEMAIFLEDSGRIRIVSGHDGQLDAMAEHYGAHAAYRVTHLGGRVSVEAVSGSRHCRMGDTVPAVRWLQDQPRYSPVRLLPAGR